MAPNVESVLSNDSAVALYAFGDLLVHYRLLDLLHLVILRRNLFRSVWDSGFRRFADLAHALSSFRVDLSNAHDQ